MATILVTGASGYIGRRFVAHAERAGHRVVLPGSSWRLGMMPSPDAFHEVDAVVHLAHSWNQGAGGGDNANLSGSCSLASVALAAGVRRFVFVSSVSARPDALNAYGRVKYATENTLLSLRGAENKVVCVRVGLSYGGELAGQYGTMSKLAGMMPLLPMIGLDREVQPIHVDEVCQGLLRLAAGPPPKQSIYVLAGPAPLRFGAWLRLLRRAKTGKRLAFIPLPLRPVLLAIRLRNTVPGFAKIDPERILGLAGTKFCESAADLGQLGIAVADPVRRLSGRRASIREARALLQYLLGRNPPRKAVIRLVRVIEREGEAALSLPRTTLRFPSLLRFLDLVHAGPVQPLGRHMHYAAMIAEALQPGPAPGLGYFAALGQLLVEVIALPFRFLMGRRGS